MKKLKLLGLVIFLTVALIFIGINLLDAQVEITGKGGKKPKPPKEEAIWTVAIPGEESDNNLYGHYPHQGNIYEDTGEGDGIYVGVEKKKGRKAAGYQFRLGVLNNIDQSGDCIGWEDGPKKIGFQNIEIALLNFADTAKDEYPCFLPPIYPPYDCNDPDLGIDDAPGCMAAFLETFLHPYCAGPHPEYSYNYVEISISVNSDIENITQEENTTGNVWIKVVNTYDLQTGCEYPHNISGHCSFEVPDGSFIIKKIDDNTWTIEVDGLFTFTEIYKGKWRNRWEYKIPYWAEIPLMFETTWTRSLPQ